MKKNFKSILLMVIFISSLSANEFQIFSSSIKNIDIDSKCNFKKIYYGSATNFYKNSSKYLTKDLLKNATTYSMMSISDGVKALAAGGTGKGGLIGLASVAVVSLGKVGYNWFTSDNEYIYLSEVTNSKGEKTLVYTLIVANNFISDKEGESLALADQKNIGRKK